MLENIFKAIQVASRTLPLIPTKKINNILLALADTVDANIPLILAANQKDLDRMPVADPRYDRLKLSDVRLHDIARDLRNVAALPSPLGISLEHKTLDNGMTLDKVTVPLGVIGIIYEARPNVTFDVFALCIKSGNACLLKGGSDAGNSNTQIVSLIKEVLQDHAVNSDTLTLLPSDRSATHELLHAVGYVDVIIPRGSQSLINYVRDHAKVPVIETGAGIVHLYYDKTADLQKGANIIFNSKTRRVSVCNALDCLILHEARLNDLPALTEKLAGKNVEIFADAKAYAALAGHYPASLLSPAKEEHFGTEFLDYKMSIKTIATPAEAFDHIAEHSSKHSEGIISEDEEAIALFFQQVDAAAVYANASTAFTDGAQFGLGAEIGISTQKLHARGPMALREITSYKWLIRGNGNVRT